MRLYKADQIGKEKVDTAKATLTALRADVKATQAEKKAIEAQNPDVDIRQAENNRADKQKQVEKAQYAVDKYTVKAPSAGKVLRTFVTVGETLGPTPHQPAVQFAAAGPDGKMQLIVRAEIDQEFAARVLPGHEHQAADIQDDVRKSGTWTGKVRRVSDWYTHRRSILLEPGQMNDVRTLEVILDLDNPPSDLKIGQRVRVMLK